MEQSKANPREEDSLRFDLRIPSSRPSFVSRRPASRGFLKPFKTKALVFNERPEQLNAATLRTKLKTTGAGCERYGEPRHYFSRCSTPFLKEKTPSFSRLQYYTEINGGWIIE